MQVTVVAVLWRQLLVLVQHKIRNTTTPLKPSVAHTLRRLYVNFVTSASADTSFRVRRYTLLASGLVAALLKYGLHAVDLYLDSQWELKPVCIFYLDLARDLVHLVLYTTFFITIFK